MVNHFGFKPDIKITDLIRSGKFTLSAEVIPPRNGTEQVKILDQIERLTSSGTEFLSVTKGAGGSLRGGSLPIAQVIKERFKVPCIAHFTCRDLTPQEVENQLVDHHYFGIRNILALRGDPPQDQPHWNPKENSYTYAYQLIDQIKKMNDGSFHTRPQETKSSPNEKTDFCIGCAVYPEHPNESERIEFLRRKTEAGAEYAISQMIFDPEAYARFLDLCEKNNLSIPILPGTRILKTQKQALLMSSRFEVSVPKSLLNSLPEQSTPESDLQAIEAGLKMIEKLKQYGAPGVHLFVLSGTSLAEGAFQRLANPSSQGMKGKSSFNELI